MAHILLLEPNTLLAAAYTRALTAAGHSVQAATGAQAAITAADSHTPDAVILELQLAGHNGVEFLHEFRSYREWQAVPVIVHTMLPPARWAPMREAFGRDLGVHAFLYKPATKLVELVQAIAAEVRAA